MGAGRIYWGQIAAVLGLVLAGVFACAQSVDARDGTQRDR